MFLKLLISLTFITQWAFAVVIKPYEPSGGNIVGNSDKPFDRDGNIISDGEKSCNSKTAIFNCTTEELDRSVLN